VKSLLLSFFLCISAYGAPNATINPEIEKIVQPFVGSGKFAGVVLVQDGPKTVHFQAYGLAEREHNIPNQLNSVFRLGSLTKQFTAALIMHLQEQGRLSVNDPVSHFLSVPDSWKGITIKHLLTHTAGLPHDFPFDAKEDSAPHTSEELLDLAKKVSLLSVPGKHFEYSNMGYSLLAIVIEKITQKDFPTTAREILNEKLGLTQTGSDHDSIITPLKSEGYNHTPMGDGRACCYEIMNLIGAGEFRSSALDLLKWADILLDNTFLSEASRAQLWAPQVQFENEGKAIPGLFYGFGWTRDTATGRIRIAHNGSVPGYVSDLAIWPEENKRVIVLSNIRDHVWNADRTGLIPVSTASEIRLTIEKLLFLGNQN
jgi:D-alanyl-D-alanine carboxypeptidase